MLRIALTAPLEDDATEESVTVAEAARRLGCAPSTVRDLLDCGELAGHRVGKTARPGGVRVHVSSIRRYKRRNTIGGTPAAANDAAPATRVVHNPAGAEARRRLRERGMLP